MTDFGLVQSPQDKKIDDEKKMLKRKKKWILIGIYRCWWQSIIMSFTVIIRTNNGSLCWCVCAEQTNWLTIGRQFPFLARLKLSLILQMKKKTSKKALSFNRFLVHFTWYRHSCDSTWCIIPASSCSSGSESTMLASSCISQNEIHFNCNRSNQITIYWNSTRQTKSNLNKINSNLFFENSLTNGNNPFLYE